MALKSVLKERAMLEQSVGMDEEDGTILFAEAVEIRCMITEKVVENTTGKGDRFINASTVLTDKTGIKVGDKINGRNISAINSIKNGKGKFLGVEAYLS